MNRDRDRTKKTLAFLYDLVILQNKTRSERTSCFETT